MGSFAPSHYETPEERLKRMILEALDDARRADVLGKRREFCINIKHFVLLMKSHIPSTTIDNIEKAHETMTAETTKIKADEDVSIQEREKEILKKEYEFYSQTLVDGIDALQNSRIMQKQMSGIIMSGKTMEELNELGKKIRSSDAVETVIEQGEGPEEGGEV